MAGSWEITDGQTTSRVTQAEYAALVKDRPAYLPKITVLSKGRMRATFQNESGEWVDELVDPGQIEHHAKYGSDISSTEEKREFARKDLQERTIGEMAERENLLSFTRSALPGAQIIENMLVGADEAAEARQQLERNSLMNLGGNLLEFTLGAKGLSMGFKGLLGAERAAKVGAAIGFGPKAGLAGRAGRLIAEDVAIETHLYREQLKDRNAPFVAEDWASQVGVGLLIASPIIGGGISRAVGKAALGALGPGAASKLSTLGDVLTTGAILSPPGTMGAAVKARAGAAAHVAGRTIKKLVGKGKGRALSATDELAEQQARQLDDMAHVGGTTPEALARMRPGKRAEFLARYKEIARGDHTWMDSIDWDGIVANSRAMQTQARAVAKKTLDIHKRFQGDAVEVKMSQAAYGRAVLKTNELLKHTEDVGMVDVKGALQRGIIAGGDATTLQRSMMEARINARFRHGIDGGADIVEQQLREFTEDSTIWGAQQAKKNKKMNDAIDGVVDVWDGLNEVKVPKHLETVELSDGLKIGNAQAKIKDLREHMNVMADSGLISKEQLRGIETKLIEASDSFVRGTKAYADVIKINRSVKETSAVLQKQADLGMDIPTSQTTFAAQRDAMVGETAGRVIELGEATAEALAKGINWVSDPKRTVPMIRGVAGLQHITVEEKRALFETLQEEIPKLTGNPEVFIRKMEPLLNRGAQYDPVGTDLAGSKMVNAVYWLANQMPRPDDTIYGRAAPSPLSEVEEYLEKFLSVQDPISTAYAALQGRITPGMVSAVRVTAPAMYAELNSVFADALANIEANKADPKVVAGISLFLGGLDPMYSGDFIMKLQSSYAQTTTQQGVIQGGVNNMPNPKTGSPAGNAASTTSQRQQN